MRHRLGRFEPKPGSSVYDSMHLHTKLSPLLTRALLNRLESPSRGGPDAPQGGGLTAVATAGVPWRPPVPEDRRRFPGLAVKPGPDLMTKLPYGHPDRVWVMSVKNQLEELARGLEFRLLDCEYEPGPDGFLAIAGTSPSIAASVRDADPVVAGFVAVRDREHPVRVIPRVFRVVSSTGALVWVRESEHEFQGLLVEEQVMQCFDVDRFRAVAEQLREAADLELPDASFLPDEAADERADDDGDESPLRDQVEARWWDQGDRTAYGLANAVSGVARDLADFRTRLRLEELAGTLARLTLGPRSHRPDLVPPPVLV